VSAVSGQCPRSVRADTTARGENAAAGLAQKSHRWNGKLVDLFLKSYDKLPRGI
jgi:hypothetical protein